MQHVVSVRGMFLSALSAVVSLSRFRSFRVFAQKSLLPLIGALALAAGGAWGEEVSLGYTLSPDGPPVAWPGQKMLASDAPLQVVKLPTLRSRKPLYLTARLGGGAGL